MTQLPQLNYHYLQSRKILIIKYYIMKQEPSPINHQQSKPKQEISPCLRQIIVRTLSETSNHHTISLQLQNQQINLVKIENQPPYFTDGDICIQANIGNCSNKNLALNPNNQKITQYYTSHRKPHLIYNCHDRTVTQQPMEYANPYHPCYHFKDYERFKKGRNQFNVNTRYEVLLIKKWRLSLVNISGTGYYAPIIMINQFKKWENSEMLIQKVQNVLFCQQIAKLLEKFRIADLKFSYAQSQGTENSDLLTYHMKFQNTVSKNKNQLIVNLDRKGEILCCNNSEKFSYAPIGNLNRINIFKRKVQDKMITNRSKINFDQMPQYQSREELSEDQYHEIQSQSLWSDQDEECENQNRRIKAGQIDREEIQRIIAEQEDKQKHIEIESQSDEPDILRQVYRGTYGYI